MAEKSEFYTLKGYHLKKPSYFTEAMEDYIEMIYRKTRGMKTITVKSMAESLNVKPSSVSKMFERLKEVDFILFERYKEASLTEKGKQIGKYLLYRHNTLHKFFKKINGSDYSLEQVEKLEHFIDDITIHHIHEWLKKES